MNNYIDLLNFDLDNKRISGFNNELKALFLRALFQKKINLYWLLQVVYMKPIYYIKI